ncbi:MAG: UPF0280 family protein [Pseudomonadota bacterium]
MKTTTQKGKRPDPLSYKERSYRQSVASEGLTPCRITICETDLFILADCDVKDIATRLVMHYRSQLEGYIARNPAFLRSLSPLPMDVTACRIVKAMIQAASAAGVGPMAAVAGSIAEFVGRDILQSGCSTEIIIENGGDIFLSRSQASSVSIYAGTSPLSNKIGLNISPSMTPLGVCTSSGTIGHSLSLGQADSVTVLAPSTPLADAAATRLGNEIKKKTDIQHAIEIAKTLPGLTGVVIVQDDRLGVWGEIELIPLPA